jgi:beta-mannosidase
MSTRPKSIAGRQHRLLVTAWEMCPAPAGAYDHPESLTRAALTWTAARAPSTVADCLRSTGSWSLDSPVRRFDAEDWWFRARFPRPSSPGERVTLGFDGLATVADVWMNGVALLHSDNMFVAHELYIGESLREENELLIRFRALDALLEAKRPRPKWRTPMIENQQLRWYRTTLLGRTPGWSPPAAAVGPWRAVWLETRSSFSIEDVVVRTRVTELTGATGTGWIEVECRAPTLRGADIERVTLALTRYSAAAQSDARSSAAMGAQHTVALTRRPESDFFTGHLDIPQVSLWWPHTHGEPALYEAQLRVRLKDSTDEVTADLGRVGFRTLQLDTSNGDFALRVNGVPVFCRGACWTPIDPVSLSATPAATDSALSQVRAAGMNMLRVGGTMVYESDDFLEACDAHGILLWQDFMFANMSYPEDDAAFMASVATEAGQQLARLAGHPCLAILCGNSEGEQQAAMWGAPRESWSPKLFHQVLAELAEASLPEVPYWPSSAHGGAFPHQGNTGTTSYYGVGAYLRPLEDARRAEIRFASECLAFANVPQPHTLTCVPGGAALRNHHPAWKARTPRDLGAGWDFDDVRDHYLTRLFGVDPLDLRYSDHDRYLAMSRIVSGEVMAAAFTEWRRKRSTCRGALLWFWRDLWCGAGWGVIDAPKAAYHYLRRVSQPLAVFMSDEGGNGIFVHIANERAVPLESTLELTLYRAGEVAVSKASRALTVPARDTLELAAVDLFAGFLDISYAYQFAPPSHDLIVATLHGANGAVLSEAFHFDLRRTAASRADLGLTAAANARPDNGFDLKIRTRRFAQSVWIEADGFDAEDEYFHLAPGAEKTVVLRPNPNVRARVLRGGVHALNALTPAKVDKP